MCRAGEVSKGRGRQNRQVATSRRKNFSESCPQIKRLSQGEHMRQAALATSRIWSIRTKLRMQVRQRDLAAFH
jgi:hypothetical protein